MHSPPPSTNIPIIHQRTVDQNHTVRTPLWSIKKRKKRKGVVPFSFKSYTRRHTQSSNLGKRNSAKTATEFWYFLYRLPTAHPSTNQRERSRRRRKVKKCRVYTNWKSFSHIIIINFFKKWKRVGEIVKEFNDTSPLSRKLFFLLLLL